MVMLLSQLYLFGAFQLLRGGKALAGFRGDKTRALLAYLALQQGQPVERQQLTALLWDGYSPSAAKASLRVALSNLRQILAPLPLVEHGRQAVQLSIDPAAWWCDAAALMALLTPGSERSPRERWASAQQLYRGEFLPGFEDIDSQPFQIWLQTQRNTLRQQLEQLRPAAVTTLPLPNNLGRMLTPLIGRQAEIRTLQRLLTNPDYPLITVVGEGGVGKTRLALAVAQTLIDEAVPSTPMPGVIAIPTRADLSSTERLGQQLSDGVWLVSLTDIVPTTQVPEQIAVAIGAALRFSFYRTESFTTQLVDYLREKALLLILDNFEHLLSGVDFLLTLLREARQVKLLVTSRQQLRVQAEYLFPLQGLPIPEDRTDFHEPANNTTERPQALPSVQLFLERTRRVVTNFRPNQHIYADIAAICRLVNGLPLAIELAAAQVAQRPCSEIRQALATNYAVLTADLHDVPPRHRSLRLVLEASWRLLRPEEAQVLAQCTLFQGGFTAAAAAAITSAEPRHLERLVQHSLLHNQAGGRYLLHELVRQFAGQTWQATAAEQLAATALRHSQYYLTFVSAQGPVLQGETPQQALALIRPELMNIQAAWHWTLQHGHWQLAAHGSAALANFYQMASLAQNGVEEFALAIEIAQRTLAQGNSSATLELKAALAQLHCAHAQLLLYLGRNDAAIEAAQQTLLLAQVDHAPTLVALARCYIGAALARQGQPGEARVQLMQALEVALTAALPTALIEIHNELGRLEYMEAHYAEAVGWYEAALAGSRTHHQRAAEVKILNRLAGVYHVLDDYPQVNRLMEQALELARQIEASGLETELLNGLGLTWAMRGDYSAAYHYLTQALAALQVTGNRITQAQIFCNLGTLMSRIGDYVAAFRYTEQGCQLMQLTGSESDLATALFNLSFHAQHLGDNLTALRYSQLAVQHSQQVQNRNQESGAWNYQGEALASLGQPVEAAAAFHKALALAHELALPLLQINPLAGLIQISRDQGDSPAQSLGYVEEMLTLLAQLPLDSLEEPFDVYLTCYQVLVAQGDPRAEPLLREAYTQLQARAALISDEAMRHSFLTRVIAHRELMELGSRIRS